MRYRERPLRFLRISACVVLKSNLVRKTEYKMQKDKISTQCNGFYVILRRESKEGLKVCRTHLGLACFGVT